MTVLTGAAATRLAQCPDQAWLAQVHEALAWWSTEGWRLAGRPEPTSQVLGTGAVRVAEELFAARWSGQAVMTASNTAAMIATLRALDLAGSVVLVQPMEWPSTRAVVEALGAVPHSLPVEPGAAVGPFAVARALAAAEAPASAVRAVITEYYPQHDYRAIRQAYGDLTLIEDAATAPAAPEPRSADPPDVAVFSFGPGKAIDVGEGGMINILDPALVGRLLRCAVHPARLLQLAVPDHMNIHLRPHPLAAVLLAHLLVHGSGATSRR